MPQKIDSTADLVAALKSIQPEIDSPKASGWYSRTEEYLARIANGTPSRLREQEFLKDLFDNETLSATGLGFVDLNPALNNPEFRDWLAQKLSRPLSQEPEIRLQEMVVLYRDLLEEFKRYVGRKPRLKVNRALCALFPEDFTTIGSLAALKSIHIALGGSGKDGAVQMHKAVRSKIDPSLTSLEGEPPSLAKCVSVPWIVYDHLVRAKEVVPLDESGDSPDAVRIPGMTALGGRFDFVLGMLPQLVQGLTREEFAEAARLLNPNLGEAGIDSALRVLTSELGVCDRVGDGLILNRKGRQVHDEQSPEPIADDLIKRIIGLDLILKMLGSEPASKRVLVAALQQLRPSWSSKVIPESLLKWCDSLGLIESDGDDLALTERGIHWSQRVTWNPSVAVELVEAVEVAETLPPPVEHVKLPVLTEVKERLDRAIGGRLQFDARLVNQLHAGLWSHAVRHFAVLTGISGAGKTQLALNYAQALCDDVSAESPHVSIIPVQPGWFDASHLLGYPSPFQESVYRRTAFLDLVLAAVMDPTRPYVAILDEMNLSHPEQYLAPVLSAMETEGWLEIHGQSSIEDVPRRVRYPANLAIIGTLNMDETTHGLSDKVLDRAYTLEFWKTDVESHPEWRSGRLNEELTGQAQRLLVQLEAALSPYRLHFGMRTVKDVVDYLAFLAPQGDDEVRQVLDDVIHAKVLPKLRGEERVTRALELCLEVLKDAKLSQCCAKLQLMLGDLRDTGTARYWR